MKTTHFTTYKRITRAFYLLGVIFVLAGLLLSMVNTTVLAQNAPDNSSSSPTRLPPGGKLPPAQRTAAPQPPANLPPSGPVNPSNGPRNGSSLNLNRGQSVLPDLNLRSGISVLADVPTGKVTFLGGDFCLAQPTAGWVSADVKVSLPAGVTAYLQMNWYVVWPNPDATNPAYNQQTYKSQAVKDGDVVSMEAWWPGANAYDGVRNVEIHWGAQLFADEGLSTGIGKSASKDAFFGGRCDENPGLVLTHVCETDGITWTISNQTSINRYYSYSVDGQAAEEGTLAPDSSTTFTTTGGAHTVSLSWDTGLGSAKTITSTSEATCGVPVSVELSLNYQCTAEGLQWTVSNPSASPINFNWEVAGEGQSGSGTVPANGSTNITTTNSTAAHLVKITWALTKSAEKSSPANACAVPVLEVLHACVTDGQGIQWSVRNNSTVDTSFTWTLDSGTPSSSQPIAAGQTVVVTTTPAGEVHTVAVAYANTSASATSTANECVAPPALTLSKQCGLTNGGIIWSVANASASPVTFSWTLDSGQSTSQTVPASSSVQVVTSTGGAHTLNITWGTSGSASLTSQAEECGGANRPAMVLAYTCTSLGVEWTVRNPGSDDVVVSWTRLVGAVTTNGSLTVAHNSTAALFTTALGQEARVTLSWPNGNNGTDSTQVTAPQDACSVPQPLLTLSYTCVDDGHIRWTVRNQGEQSVNFEWLLDNKSSGSDTVGTGTSSAKHFLVSSAGKHTVKVTYNNGNSTLTRSSNSGSCVVEEPTQTPTSPVRTVIVVTATPVPSSTPTATPTTQPTVAVGPSATPTITRTPLATVGAPAVGSGGNNVIIPVTGADLSGGMLSTASLWQKILLNLGMMFLGIAFVFEGITRRFRK